MYVIKQGITRRTIKVIAKYKNDYEHHTVFQSSSRHGATRSMVTLQDVDDHLNAVERLKDSDKEDYFLAHGMDYKRCRQYVNIVKYMNRCFDKTTKTSKFSDKTHWIHMMFLHIAFVCSYIHED